MKTLSFHSILRRTDGGRAELLCAAHDLSDWQRTVLSVVTGHTELSQLFGPRAGDALAAAEVLCELGLLQQVPGDDELPRPWDLPRPVAATGSGATGFL